MQAITFPTTPLPGNPPLISSEGLFEVVDGQAVEVPTTSFLANLIANRLMHKLSGFLDYTELGFAVAECLFKLSLPVDRQRRPDVAFVSAKRWPKENAMPLTGNSLPVTPDLLVEVVSPTDLVDEVYEKMYEYFRAGAEQVWIVHPKQGTIELFDSPMSSRWLAREQVLEGIPFLPGFRLPLAEIFEKA
ncbi:MAG: Uma2 family endonuclease [Gemmataceae bacterium]|nr:Uma2 family endonuclease [Gemmataceae bacterium]